MPAPPSMVSVAQRERSSVCALALVLVVSLNASACGTNEGEGDSGTGGADASGGGTGEGGSAGGSARTFEEIRDELEEAILDYDTGVPFTLVLGDDEGTFFEASNGDSSSEAVYESASTSKWVAAAVVLHAVQTTGLELDSRAADILPFWLDDPADWRSEITLEHLLSFTSGLQPKDTLLDASCISLPNADFDSCVELIYEAAEGRTEVPGSEFVYGGNHLQVAGQMAVVALDVDSFSEVFADFRTATGLFPTSEFDLPSADNPRLAGGMHWTATEYMEFLRALYLGEILTPELRTALFTDHTLEGEVEIVESPIRAIDEMWHYDLGNWRECPLPEWQGACDDLERFSSPGAYGAYPFVDFARGYYGMLSRQGPLGSFRDGLEIYRDLSPLVDELVEAKGTR